MKLIYYTLLYILSAFACSMPIEKKTIEKAKPVFTFKDFRKTVELHGRAIELKNITLPVRLTLAPDKNVFMCIDATGRSKKCIAIYSLDSLKFIRSVINRGLADDELATPFQLQYSSRNGGEVYVLDTRKQQMAVYNADSLIAGVERPLKLIRKPGASMIIRVNEDRLLRSVVIDKSHTVVDIRNSGLNYSRMFLNKYRNDLSVRDSFGLYPKGTEEIPIRMLNEIIEGCLNISTDNKYVIFSCLTTDYLALYDTSGKMITSAIGPREMDVNYGVRKMGNGEQVVPLSDHKGYWASAKMNKNSVLVLYSGKDRKDPDEHVTDLLQFDQLLRPGTRYKLDLSVYDFEIDWRTKRIYGLRKYSTPELVIFQL